MFVQPLGDWMMLLCCYHTGDKFIVCTTQSQGDNHLLLYRYEQSSGKQVNLCMYAYWIEHVHGKNFKWEKIGKKKAFPHPVFSYLPIVYSELAYMQLIRQYLTIQLVQISAFANVLLLQNFPTYGTKAQSFLSQYKNVKCKL